MNQINLLPWREQIKHEKVIFFSIELTFGLIITIALAVIINLFLFAAIKNQVSRNNYLTTQLGNENSRLISFNTKIKELHALNDDLSKVLLLKESSYQAVRQLNELAKIVPDTISINKISRVDSQITLTGTAKSNLQITFLMKNIAASTIFSHPNLTEINTEEKNENDEKEFILTMQTRNQVTQ